MPRGDKSAYTDKQKRQAEHIEEGYEDRGVSSKTAKARAWATVNKESGGGKKSGSGRGKKGNKSSSKKGGKESRQEVFFQEEVAPASVYFESEFDSSFVTAEGLTLAGGETTVA